MSELEQSIQTELIDPKRRAFLEKSLKALGAVLVLELSTSGFLFLRARSLAGQYGGLITAGSIDEIANGTVTVFEDGNFYLVRTAAGGFMAVFRRCPHLGCTVDWVPQKNKFFCPCHSASFDPNGEYQNQIVARSLDTFPILFEDGMVKVDTSMAQAREHHQPDDIYFP